MRRLTPAIARKNQRFNGQMNGKAAIDADSPVLYTDKEGKQITASSAESRMKRITIVSLSCS
jgi:hypothetical protein